MERFANVSLTDPFASRIFDLSLIFTSLKTNNSTVLMGGNLAYHCINVIMQNNIYACKVCLTQLERAEAHRLSFQKPNVRLREREYIRRISDKRRKFTVK